jgi:sulfide:quinone oxidoreductase
LKDNNRVVLLKNGAQVDNDALIIASGGHFIKKLPGIENAIIPCEGFVLFA